VFHYLLFQKVIQVNNYYSLEQTVFNLLRSKRPISKANEDMREYVEKLNVQTKKTCDFCRYETNTAEDVFGRFVAIFLQCYKNWMQQTLCFTSEIDLQVYHFRVYNSVIPSRLMVFHSLLLYCENFWRTWYFYVKLNCTLHFMFISSHFMHISEANVLWGTCACLYSWPFE
jgi:hypothetical protein